MKQHLVIADGFVQRVDDEDNGTTRKTWRALISLADPLSGSVRRYEGRGEGKAAHVALSRAAAAAVDEAKRLS